MRKLTLLIMCFVMAFVANAQVQDTIFKERFNTHTGTGGNDGLWDNSAGQGSLDSVALAGWTLTKAYGADKCIKLGTTSAKGIAQTPALTTLNGDATLKFRAGAWNGSSEKLNVVVRISGGGQLSSTALGIAASDSVAVAISKAAFTDIELQITGGTSVTKLSFEGVQAARSRFFLDDVVVVSGNSVTPPTPNPYNLDDSNPLTFLFEDFEGGAIPATWKNIADAGDRTWGIKTYSGNHYVQLSANGGTGAEYRVLLISPAVNLDTIKKNQVSFDWKSGYTNGAILKVYVMSKDGTKTEIKSINDNANTGGYGQAFNTETLDLTAFSGVKFLAFEYNGTSTQTTTYQIDNINAPGKGPYVILDKTALTFENITINTTSAAQSVMITAANLNAAPTVTIEGADAALFAQSGTLTTDGGTLSITFAPTTVGTKTATLKITADTLVHEVALTGTAVDASNPYNLDDSNPLTTLSEDFEGGAMPTDWKTVMEQGNKNWGYATYSGNSYATINPFGGSGVFQALLISPAINFDAVTNKTLSFDWKGGYTNGSELKVYIMSKDGAKSEIKSIIAQGEAKWGANYTNEQINLNTVSGVKFIVFEYNGNSETPNTTAYQVDNVKVPASTTGIEIVEEAMSVYASQGKIYVSATAGEQISVFSVAGQKIFSATANEGLNELSLNYNGVAIVRVGSKVAKVIL